MSRGSISRLIIWISIVGGVVAWGRPPADLSEPEDRSLEISEYIDLGVPDPRREWTAKDLMTALRVLRSVPGSRLPRRSSEQSGILFDRLLASFRRGSTIEDGGAMASAVDLDPPPSLPTLYEERIDQGVLYGEELVEIRSALLSLTLETVPARDELRSMIEQLQGLPRPESSVAGMPSRSERLVALEQAAASVRETIKKQVLELLELSSLPELSLDARLLMMDRAESIFPELRSYLLDADLEFVSAFMRGAARAPVNRPIRDRMIRLAEAL